MSYGKELLHNAALCGGYLLDTLSEEKQIEIDHDGNMTFHVQFKPATLALWRYVVRQADNTWKFDNEGGSLRERGWVERAYDAENGQPFGLLIFFEVGTGSNPIERLSAQLTVEHSDKAINAFVDWNATAEGICDKFRQLLRIASSSNDVNNAVRPLLE